MSGYVNSDGKTPSVNKLRKKYTKKKKDIPGPYVLLKYGLPASLKPNKALLDKIREYILYRHEHVHDEQHILEPRLNVTSAAIASKISMIEFQSITKELLKYGIEKLGMKL